MRRKMQLTGSKLPGESIDPDALACLVKGRNVQGDRPCKGLTPIEGAGSGLSSTDPYAALANEKCPPVPGDDDQSDTCTPGKYAP